MMRFDPTLSIERMRITRGSNVAFDEEFHPGVNVISGENSSGKSTLLNFLFYGLGGELTDWSAVAKLCDRVYLQISVNGKLVTLSREVSTESKRPMDLFFGELEDGLSSSDWLRYPYSRSESKESFSQALFRLLDMPEVLADVSGNLTVNQLLRLLYSDQLTPVESLFKYQGAFDDPALRDAVGRLVFGAHSSEFYDNIVELRNLRRQYDELNGEYRSLVQAASEVSEGFTAEWVGAERRRLEGKASALETRIEELERSQSAAAQEEYSLNALDAAYEQTVRLQGLVAELSRDRDVLAVRISEGRRFITSLEAKLASLNDSALVGAELGEIRLAECPACHSVLSLGAVGHCYLCHAPTENGSDRARISRLINETAQQIRESRGLLDQRASDAAEIDRRLLEVRRSWSVTELARIKGSAVSRHSQALAEANKMLGYVRRQLDDNFRQAELAKRIEELGERRAFIRGQMDELEARNEALSRQQSERIARVSTAVAGEIRELLVNDLRRQDVFEDPKEIAFSFRENFISINQERYFSASSRAILKSSFVLALLAAATKIPYMRHPRFCIIDSLENMGVEAIRSANFQEEIVQVSHEAKVEHQIIFGTAMIADSLNNERYIVGRHYTREDRSLAIG